MKQVTHRNKPHRAAYENAGFIVALVLVMVLLVFIVFYWIVKNP